LASCRCSNAPTAKKTSVELGGNAPFTVFDDTDIANFLFVATKVGRVKTRGPTMLCPVY